MELIHFSPGPGFGNACGSKASHRHARSDAGEVTCLDCRAGSSIFHSLRGVFSSGTRRRSTGKLASPEHPADVVKATTPRLSFFRRVLAFFRRCLGRR